MSKEIIVDINKFQTRVVLLEEGDIAEVYIERTGRERLVGNIYKGKVANVLPGMQAAFVDIGLPKNAFLYAGDILFDKSDLEFIDQAKAPEIPANIKDIVKPGQEIMLQILKEPMGTKGVRVTTHITLPSRMCVLMPTVNYIGVSRRIENEEERARLRSIIEKVKPENMGVIVRTAAEGKSEEEFITEIDFLSRLWERVQKTYTLVNAPRLIHGEEPLVYRTIRDIFTKDIDRLIINDENYCEKVKVVAGIISPALEERVSCYDARDELFDHFDIESKLEKLLSRKVWLKNGGYIVIDQTEALTAIDVNTGKYVGGNNLQETLYETNIEAAKIIAKQLRLRDISGIIIIDFIDMEDQENKDSLIQVLEEELKKDRTKTNVLGMTGLGLVEMTRKKVRKSFSATIQMPCPLCKGEGKVQSIETIALGIRKKLMREFNQSNQNEYIIELHQSAADYILKFDPKEEILPLDLSKEVYLKANNALDVAEYKIIPVTDSKMLKVLVSEGIARYY